MLRFELCILYIYPNVYNSTDRVHERQNNYNEDFDGLKFSRVNKFSSSKIWLQLSTELLFATVFVWWGFHEEASFELSNSSFELIQIWTSIQQRLQNNSRKKKTRIVCISRSFVSFNKEKENCMCITKTKVFARAVYSCSLCVTWDTTKYDSHTDKLYYMCTKRRPYQTN